MTNATRDENNLPVILGTSSVDWVTPVPIKINPVTWRALIDVTWGAGAGDVTWPASSTDNALARFDSTTWKLLQDWTITEDDSWNLSSVWTINWETIATWTNTWDQNLTPLVTWPASSIDDNIATYDTTTGKLIKDWWTSISVITTKIEWIILTDADCDTITTGGRYWMIWTPTNSAQAWEFYMEVLTDWTSRTMQIATYLDNSVATRVFTWTWSSWIIWSATNTNTWDMSDANVKTAYENNADTNAFTDSEQTIVWNTSNTNTGDQTIPDNTDFVDLTTAQSVAWVKTFSVSPIVPAPTTDLQASTKKYVDDNWWNPLTIISDISWVSWADAVDNIISLTQAEYDAITPDSATIYNITDADAWWWWGLSEDMWANFTGSLSLTTTNQTVIFWNEENDTWSNYNNATWIYTCPSDWVYEVTTNVRFSAWNSADEHQASILVEWTIKATGEATWDVGSHITVYLWKVLYWLTSWDEIKVDVRNNTTSRWSIFTGAVWTYLFINKVG